MSMISKPRPAKTSGKAMSQIASDLNEKVHGFMIPSPGQRLFH